MGTEQGPFKLTMTHANVSNCSDFLLQPRQTYAGENGVSGS